MTPDCQCHGLPKVWVPRDTMVTGGFWRCNAKQHRMRIRKEKQRERSRAYRKQHPTLSRERYQQNVLKMSYTTGRIPLEPVRRVVEDFIASTGWTNQPSCDGQGERMVKPLAPLERLRHWAGLESDLYFIRRRNKKWIDFDLADRVITALNPMLWHSDPELNTIYNEANLAALDARDAA